MNQTMTQHSQLATGQFLDAIFAGALFDGEGICVRALQHGGGKVEQRFYDDPDVLLQDQDIQKWNAQFSIYFGTAIRDLTSADKAKKPGCVAITALWADLDAKDFTTPKAPKAMTPAERKAGKRLIGLCLKDKLPEALLPSILVDTGGGYQAYWLLKEPIRIGPDDDRGYTVETLEGYLAGLQQHLGADPSRKDVTSIMRLPGTANAKYPERPICRVIRFSPERRFNLSDFDEYRAVPAAAPVVKASEDAGQDFPELLEAFKTRGLYIRAKGEKHLVVCPWKDTHTIDSGPTQTALYEPSADNGRAGGFKCQHSHCADRTISGVYQLFVPQPAPPTVGESASSTLTSPSPRFPAFIEISDTDLFYGAADTDIVEHIDYHWDGFVVKGSIVTTLGAKKALKSWLQSLLAVSAANTEPLFPGFPSGGQRVMLITGPRENSERETKRRIRSLRRQFGLQPGNGQILVRAYRTAVLRLESKGDSPEFAELLVCIRAFKPDALIFDSVGALWGGKNENDTAEARTWLEKRVELIVQAAPPGATIYLGAHTGHAIRFGKLTFAQKHQRGASGWGDAADTLIFVEKVEPPAGSTDGTAAAVVSMEYTRLGEATPRRLLLTVEGGPRSGMPIKVNVVELEAGTPTTGAPHPVRSKALEDAHQLVKEAEEAGIFRPALLRALEGMGNSPKASRLAVEVLAGLDGHPWPEGPYTGRVAAVVDVRDGKNPETGRKADLLVYRAPDEMPAVGAF